jgi:hypothetical protein
MCCSDATEEIQDKVNISNEIVGDESAKHGGGVAPRDGGGEAPVVVGKAPIAEMPPVPAASKKAAATPPAVRATQRPPAQAQAQAHEEDQVPVPPPHGCCAIS